MEEALRYEGVTVLSVDLSEDMVRRASERNAAAVSQVSVAMITSNSHSSRNSNSNSNSAPNWEPNAQQQ